MSERLDVDVRARDAATRFRTVAFLLREQAAVNEHQRFLAAYTAATLLRTVLWEAESLVRLLGDDSKPMDEDTRESLAYGEEEVRDAARVLYEMLRNRDRARKLEQVDGCAPEEAAGRLAKARELRGEAA